MSLLCSQASAVDGHLFLLQGAELELVASFGDRPPPQGIRELAQARVTPQDDDQATVAVALTSVPPPDPATLGFRVQGLSEADIREYTTLCIRADLGGESALIGVAVLGFVGPIELRPEVLALANAFGDYLLRSGTSVSVTAKSGSCTREL